MWVHTPDNNKLLQQQIEKLEQKSANVAQPSGARQKTGFALHLWISFVFALTGACGGRIICEITCMKPTKTFAGFRSRCTKPRSWMYNMPLATSQTNFITCGQSSRNILSDSLSSNVPPKRCCHIQMKCISRSSHTKQRHQP